MNTVKIPEIKTITILGDSLSMNRSEADIMLSDTYGVLLSKLLSNNYYINNRSRRGNTVNEQLKFQNIYDDIETTKSDYYIIQLGIVDCAPRIFTKQESDFIRDFLPGFCQKVIINFFSKHRKFLTKHFPKQYTKYDDFVDKYKQIVSTIKMSSDVKKIFIFTIANTTKENNLKSYNFSNYILKYNEFLYDLIKKETKCEVIDLFNLTKENNSLLLEDGIHISKKCHEIIAEQLFSKISNYR